jgi:hypothetical protein
LLFDSSIVRTPLREYQRFPLTWAVKETLRHSQPMAAASVRRAKPDNIASNSNLCVSVEGAASPIGAMATRRATRGELILKFGG